MDRCAISVCSIRDSIDGAGGSLGGMKAQGRQVHQVSGVVWTVEEPRKLMDGRSQTDLLRFPRVAGHHTDIAEPPERVIA